MQKTDILNHPVTRKQFTEVSTEGAYLRLPIINRAGYTPQQVEEQQTKAITQLDLGNIYNLPHSN